MGQMTATDVWCHPRSLESSVASEASSGHKHSQPPSSFQTVNPGASSQEGPFSLPNYTAQQIPQSYKELAEPWIKVSTSPFNFSSFSMIS